MQLSKNLFKSNSVALCMHAFGLLLLSSSTSYALFESYDCKRERARDLVSVLSVKYNQYFDEMPYSGNKESVIERNLCKLGFDINYIGQITMTKLQQDIDDLNAAAASLRPWNPFYSMDSDASELYDELIRCASKAERVIKPIKANYKLITGYKIYHLYDNLPVQCSDMASWIYNYYYTGYSNRMNALLHYEDHARQDVSFIDSLSSLDRSAYPYLSDKLRSRRSAIIGSISMLKNSYDYQDALRQKRHEEELVLEMQRIARERELRAEHERKLLEMQAARYALESERLYLERQQQALYNNQYHASVSHLTTHQIAIENQRLQVEIDQLKLKMERDRLLNQRRY